MNIGYARVSSTSQTLERQIEALNNYGVDKIYQDVFTGSNFSEREGLNEMLQYAREQDVIVVDSLERLGRNYKELIKLIHSFEDKKIRLVVLNIPVLSENIKDDNLSMLLQNLTIQILAWVSESERQELKRKQKQGIGIAKKNGAYKGKVREYSATTKNKQKRLIYNNIISMLYDNVPVAEIHRITGVARNTIYDIKRNDIQTLGI